MMNRLSKRRLILLTVPVLVSVAAIFLCAVLLSSRPGKGEAKLCHVDSNGAVVLSGIDITKGGAFDWNSQYLRTEPVTLTKGAELFDVDFTGLYFSDTSYYLLLNVRSKNSEQDYIYGGCRVRLDTGRVYRSWPRGVCERLDKHGNTVEERDIEVETLFTFPHDQTYGSFIKPSGESCLAPAPIPFSEPGTYRMTLYFFEYLPERDKVRDRYEEVSFIVSIEPQRADVELLGGWISYLDDDNLDPYCSCFVFRGDEDMEIIDARCSDPQYEIYVPKYSIDIPSATAFLVYCWPCSEIHQSPQIYVELTFSRSNGDTFDMVVSFGQDAEEPASESP